MDPSTTHRASPLCLDLTFPSGATQEEEEEEKTENRKLKGFWEFFLSCLPPDSVFACTYQTLGETHKGGCIQHRCIDTHGEGEDPPRIIRSVTPSNSPPPTKLEHQHRDPAPPAQSVYGPVYSGAAN